MLGNTVRHWCAHLRDGNIQKAEASLDFQGSKWKKNIR